jgi:exonuclease SbcD
VDYVALGHLHGRQQVTDTVRYSGSPVAMSFSECHHRKGSWLVDLSGSARDVTHVEAPVGRPLACLTGDLEDLLRDPRHTDAERAWCQVTLTDPARPTGAMDRLRARFPHTLDVRFAPRGVVTEVRTYAARLAGRGEVDVCCDFLGHVRSGVGASEEERTLLEEAFEAARLVRATAEGEGGVAATSEPAA